MTNQHNLEQTNKLAAIYLIQMLKYVTVRASPKQVLPLNTFMCHIKHLKKIKSAAALLQVKLMHVYKNCQKVASTCKNGM